MTNKSKLIEALTIAINALESDWVLYDWRKHSSCNVGVVAQVLTGKSASELADDIDGLIEDFENANDQSPNWSMLTKFFCPLTGLSQTSIFKTLQEAGMTRDDIINLEFLADPKVIERTKISVTVEPKRRRFFSSWYDDTKNVSGTFERDITEFDDGDKDEKYYMKKPDLLRYLKAWKELLLEEQSAVAV